MKRSARLLFGIPAVLLAAVLMGPFFVPVPPLAGTVPPEQLADPDSRFVTVSGVRLHYKVTPPAGAGRAAGAPAFILLHGFAASTFSWREAVAPLSQFGTVVAYDRPAFGLTQRPLPGQWSGPNPYGPDIQPALLLGLMDHLGIQRAVLVGNSAGGTVAVLTALQHPDRVQALVLVDAAIYQGGGALPAWARPLLQSPQGQRLGPLFVRRIQNWGLDFGRSAWHDPSKITAEILKGYTRPLSATDWDRGLWELTLANRPLDLGARLGSLSLPVLVITGDDDRIVKTADSIRLGREVPGAQLVVIPDCGHVPQEECPDAFIDAMSTFVRSRL